jgi:hypothetical protein
MLSDSQNDSLYQIRSELGSKIHSSFNGIIQSNTFKGCFLPEVSEWTGTQDLGSKLLGIYEQDVLEFLNKTKGSYKFLIDIGAADGYYVVGSVFAGIVDRAYGFEINEKSRDTMIEKAKINNVLNSVYIDSEATLTKINNILNDEDQGSGIFIISYPGPYQYFDGGTITIANSYVSHTFTSTGTLTAKSPPVLATSAKLVLVTYLMIGQGGQGGGSFASNDTGGGGGGAGGFVLETKYFNYASSYLLTLTTGGLNGSPATGQKGGSTTLEDLNTTYPMFPKQIADGGGKGIWQAGDGSGTGGSGGGAWTASGSAALQPTSDTGGFGNSGARSGGGGAGGAAPGGVTGTGGVGKISNITGTDVYYAGGGKGGHAGSAGLGSIGRGGNGGGPAGTSAGGQGEAGIIILSYPAPQRFSGGTVTTLGANVLHTVTGNNAVLHSSVQVLLVGLDN